MAFSFNATDQYLQSTITGFTLSLFPMTISVWVRPTQATSFPAAVSVGSLTGNTDRNVLALAGNNMLIAANGGGVSAAVGAVNNLVATNGWNSVVGIWNSISSRSLYINGTLSATNSTVIGTPASATDIAIGARYASGAWGNFFPGDIAEVGVWSAAIGVSEITSLARGAGVASVRPQSLVYYAPLIRDLVDVRGGLAITNNNAATVANHPRVYA